MKIAIANDMPMAVAALQRVLATMPEHTVVWVAPDGADAVRQCREHPPELLLMDLFMPVMDGVEATRRIMAESACAVLIVTATVEGHSAKVYEALGAGALDAVTTPILGASGTMDGAAEFREKIAMISVLLGGSTRAKRHTPVPVRYLPADRSQPPLIAIGASAGGPVAVARLLGMLPVSFPSPIIVVQHVDQQFAEGMAEWLNGQSALPVRLARDGETPVPGTALLAGTNDHLVLTGSARLQYVREPAAALYRPSVDVFFRSIPPHWHGSVVAVLLTGMGRDGAAGMKLLREAGALTIAQDKASCTVYGMPKAAAELGAASEILALDDIGPRLAEVAVGGLVPTLRRHPHD